MNRHGKGSLSISPTAVRMSVAAVAAGGYEEQQAPAPGLGQRVSGRLADPVSLEADQRSVDIQKKSFDHSVVFRNSYSAGIARQR